MRSQRFLKVLFYLLCAIWLASCSQIDEPKYYDNKGKPVQLSGLRGKWVIVNYWASWCSACRWEVPELNNFYKNNNSKDVLIYGVDAESIDPSTQNDAIAAAGIDFPVLRQDPGDNWHIPLVELIPTTFIIDPEGKLVATISGATSEKSLTNIMRKLKNDEN